LENAVVKQMVLIVEDVLGWRENLKLMLEAAGFSCAVASNFPDAIELLQSLNPLALVLDMRLEEDYGESDWKGWELARQARFQGISSVIVTGYAKPHISSRAFREFGVIDVFDKGYLSEHRSLFIQRVAEAIEVTQRRRAELSPLLEPLRAAWLEASQSLDSSQRFASATVKILGLLSEHLGTDYKRIESCEDRFIVFSLDTAAIFGGIALLDHLPVLFCRVRDFTDREIDQLMDFLSGKEMRGVFSKVALLVVLAEAARLRETQRLLDRLNRIYAFDIMLIEQGILEGIMIDESSSVALRQFVFSHTDLRSVSPFVTTGPTTDPVFFGREQELREVSEHLGSVSFALMGGRRIGKSSLLNRLHRMILPDIGFCSVYHDCSATLTSDTFLNAAIREWRPEPPPDVPATFGDLLQSSPTDKSLVLLLDEADKLVPADRANGWPLFNALRALVNTWQVHVVLSGERTLRDALRDPKSPLFNFANEILLGPLDFHAVEELVTRPMKQLEIELVDEKAIVDCIWAFTSGHPNVIQRLCRRLIERLNEKGTRRITLDDVDAVIEDPGFQREDFLSTYWEAATSLEKIISLLMADDENVRTLRTVRQALAECCNLRPKAREVDDALQRLVDLRSILKRTPAGYEFAVEAFPRVVVGTMTLDDMLAILAEEYQEQGE
jgi:CheY-like chemotaxis protein